MDTIQEYQKTTWVNDETPLNATNLNKIEDGIETNRTNSIELKNLIDEIQCAINTYTSITYTSQNDTLSITFGDSVETPHVSKTITVTLNTITALETLKASLSNGNFVVNASTNSTNAEKIKSNGVFQTIDTILANYKTSTIAQNSTNVIESGAVYNALTTKQDVVNVEQASEGGTTESLVTTGEKYTWNHKSDFSGSYTDLTDKPTIPSYSESTTSTAGLMSAADKTKLNGIASGAEVNVQANWNETDTGSDAYIQNKPTIPTHVTDLTDANDYATKTFVNSSIATNTSYFLGTYNIVTDLELTTSATHSQVISAIVTKLANESLSTSNNDYVFVSYPDATDSTQIVQFDRYKYNLSTTSWEYEYTLNNSSFTAAQWAAINSGANTTNISQIATNTTAIAGKQNTIDSTHKLSSDLIDDTNSTNKFVTSTDKTTWNNKSVVSVSDAGTSTDEVKYITINGTEKKLAGGTQVTFVDWS